MFPPRDKLHVLPACRSALPPPTPQPPPIATSTLCRKLKEQLEDSNRHAQDGSPGRDAETTKEFPAEMPTTGPPPGSPPPPSATTALHHRPSGHSEDEQEATHDSKLDAGRAWTEGNAKIVEHPPQDERAREEQAGTDQPEESGRTPGHDIVLQRVRREGDQNRTKPEKLKNNRRAWSTGRGRTRYRADAAAAAERRVLLGGGRRCRGAGRGRSSTGVLVVTAVGELAVRGRFRLARLRAWTCGQNNDRAVGLDEDCID